MLLSAIRSTLGQLSVIKALNPSEGEKARPTTLDLEMTTNALRTLKEGYFSFYFCFVYCSYCIYDLRGAQQRH